jgi:hypothetical protein
MRIVASILVAGALTIVAAGPASAGCYRDCDDDVIHRYHGDVYDRPYHHSYHRPHHRKPYHSHRHRIYPVIIYGGAFALMGPVYASTGQYYYGPYVSHRANFGYGGCRTAYLPYGPTWQLATNC